MPMPLLLYHTIKSVKLDGFLDLLMEVKADCSKADCDFGRKAQGHEATMPLIYISTVMVSKHVLRSFFIASRNLHA